MSKYHVFGSLGVQFDPNFVLKMDLRGALIRGGGAYSGGRRLGKKWPLGGRLFGGRRLFEGEALIWENTVLAFSSRALGKARNCKFTVACPHGDKTPHDYCEDMVKHIVLAGMYDEEIKRKVLSTSKIDDKTLNETIAIIETEEMASRSMSDISLPNQAGSTSYKKQISANDKRLQVKGKCISCDGDFLCNRVKKQAGKEDTVITDKFCKPCWQKKRDEKRRKNDSGKQEQRPTNEASVSTRSEEFPFICAVNSIGNESYSPDTMMSHCATNSITIPMPHHVFDGTMGWMKKPAEPHPTITLKAFIDKNDYDHLHLPCPSMKPARVKVITDSGCQSSLLGLKTLHTLGLKKSSLVPVSGNMSAINGEGINILGAIFLRLEGLDNSSGQRVQTAVMAHVTESTDRFFISQQAMRELGIIPQDFPKVRASAQNAATVSDELGVAACGCLKHSPPPERPGSLPFEATLENVDVMRAWLLERYAGSTFNKCTHQPLPMLKTSPIKIHIDPDAVPKPVFTAATVPLAWREEVKEKLDEDVALKVIEPVPPGTPTTWQARMHVVGKSDGTSRRVVDFSPMNTYCKRETQHVVPPYKQARSIPAHTLKTVTDCWNGYHSCPLAEEDRHLTTFITEWGRFRYCVAPQGYVASGDGYNQRYDNLIADVERKTKCVDDVCMWDSTIEDHWWRVIDYLILVGKNGIILNPKKFQFCQSTVEFAGFKVTETDVKPLAKYLDAIRDFPRPTNVSEIRSWFGLVNQVSHYAKLTDLMAPFKPLLSPKTRFAWNDELEKSFQESKLEIVKAIQEGVRIFDPSRTTVLSPDWSKTGIGYFLYQKYCECPSVTTNCCKDGWRITLAGSRFLHKAERNYWPVEGEALAVAWALEDSKFFTLGCRDLHIQTDHRPLVKILGDRTLDEIHNRRLINLKEKTMPWRFKIHHVPGKLIPAPDATSRYPQERKDDVDSLAETDVDTSSSLAAIRSVREVDDLETCIVAAARSLLPSIQAVTWERVRDETSRDIYLLQLIDLAQNGFPDSQKGLPPQLLPYWRFREDLSVIDGVLMYGHRAVIPPKLREEVCANLHSAHQGVSQMQNRAIDCVFWPGITSDVQAARDRCNPCGINAPSQAKMPPAEPFVPTSPFQAVATDFFQLKGKRYLLTVDRFSNWPDLREAPLSNFQESASEGLVKAYRELFATFGVPEHLSSDGGPEYTSKTFQSFMKVWGIKHRQSSAYNPQSNGRAEVGVKSMKRLLMNSTDADGNLDTDAVMRGMLQIRNTPESDTGLSPAQILLGRKLRDSLPVIPPIPHKTTVFDQDSPVSAAWKETWEAKEQALKNRLSKQVEKLDIGSHALKPLIVGDQVRIQNQSGSCPTKWDKTGTVVQIGQHNQYLVRVDGSRRLTLRNRRFLRKLISPVRSSNQSLSLPSSSIVIPDPPASRQVDISLSPPLIDENQLCKQGRSTDSSSPSDQVIVPTVKTEPEAVSPTVTDAQALPQSPQLRKSTRVRKQRTVYDPTTGGSVQPLEVSEDI